MNQYVGLDVSLEETKIHVLDEAGGRVWRGKCASHPDELETAICKHAPGAVRIGLETGPLTTWLWTELSKRRLPMVCLDARQAQRALDMRANKTDASDADGAVLPSCCLPSPGPCQPDQETASPQCRDNTLAWGCHWVDLAR